MSVPENNDELASAFFSQFPGATDYDFQDYKDYVKELDHTFSDLIYPVSFDGIEVPVRKWVVKDWVPDNCVTGLYGDGGVGKSLLAMMLMTSVSQGYSWLGLETNKMKSFGFFCEDSKDEIHRRQDDINKHYGVQFGELQNMVWQSRIGSDNILMTFQNGLGRPTKTFEYLKETVKDFGANFVIIDTAADTFGGNENSRPEVRQYINLLNQLAMEINGAVVLCAHPSLSGLTSGSGSGGSTAWNNTLRSRLYLKHPEAKEGDEDNNNGSLRELHKKKSNYSSIGDKITLNWEKGCFNIAGSRHCSMVDQIEINARNQADEQIFLILLSEIYLSGRIVSDSKFAKDRYAPRVMVSMKNAQGITISRLEAAMKRLFDSGKIKIGEAGKRSDYKKAVGIVAV